MRISDASRAESQAAAERLVSIADLFAVRLRESGECPDFAVDTYEAVAAEVAATLRVSVAMGSSYLRYALAMRERLPQVGKAFEAGDIDYRLFRTIVFRTCLITDIATLATIDAQLAALAPRWPSMTRGKLGAKIDKLVARLDPDAVRRTKDCAPDRYVEIGESDAHVVIRLNQLVLILDAVGMGFFATSGAAIAVDHGASWFAAALLGMLSAIAGGIIRDVLARDIPMVMGPDDLYAIPAILGSITYVAIDYFAPQWIGIVAGSVLATVLRLAAMAFHWQMPTGPRELHRTRRPAPGLSETAS